MSKISNGFNVRFLRSTVTEMPGHLYSGLCSKIQWLREFIFSKIHSVKSKKITKNVHKETLSPKLEVTQLIVSILLKQENIPPKLSLPDEENSAPDEENSDDVIEDIEDDIPSFDSEKNEDKTSSLIKNELVLPFTDISTQNKVGKKKISLCQFNNNNIGPEKTSYDKIIEIAIAGFRSQKNPGALGKVIDKLKKELPGKINENDKLLAKITGQKINDKNKNIIYITDASFKFIFKSCSFGK